MRTCSILILAFLVASIAGAQQSEQAPTPVHQKVLDFQKKPGKVVLIEYTELGRLDATVSESIKFEISYSCYVLDKPKSVKALRLTTVRKDPPSGSVFFIDFDELADLSNAISTMVVYSTRSSDEERPFSDITYRTRDGFEIGYTHIGKEQSGYYKMSQGASDYASLKIELLSAFKQLVDKGIAKLKAK